MPASLFMPTRIIIHASATDDGPSLSWDNIRANHKAQGWSDIGYHAGVELVEASYEILVGRAWTRPGAHARGQNDRALGLCLVGDFMLEEPPRPQLLLAAQFTALWMTLFRIPLHEVYPHRRFAATSCPGDMFPWENFIDLIRAAR